MTIDTIIQINKDKGYFFFDPQTMRFFNSRVLETVYEGPGGVYFITSEKQPTTRFAFQNLIHPRRYTVRSFNPETGDVNTTGPFNTLTKARAATLAKKAAAGKNIEQVA
jgi:hypothetical protein